MDDTEALRGYFNAARYLSKEMLAKYGIDPSLYTNLKGTCFQKVKMRLKELLDENDFCVPQTGNELREMLGSEFGWVRSSMDHLSSNASGQKVF